MHAQGVQKAELPRVRLEQYKMLRCAADPRPCDAPSAPKLPREKVVAFQREMARWHDLILIIDKLGLVPGFSYHTHAWQTKRISVLDFTFCLKNGT